MKKPIGQFSTNLSHFDNRTARRLAFEFVILGLVLIIVAQVWDQVPRWITAGIVVISTAWILIDFISSIRARSFVKNFRLSFYEDRLGFTMKGGKLNQIMYSDLTLHSVKRKKDEVIKVELQTSFGQKIAFESLSDMAGLCALVERNISKDVKPE